MTPWPGGKPASGSHLHLTPSIQGGSDYSTTHISLPVDKRFSD